MKIIIIIYTVSWLILISIALLSFLRKNSSNPLKDKEAWFQYALLILYAPIVVLLEPFIIYSSCINERKAKQRRAEIDKQIAIMNQYIQDATTAYNAEIKIPHENHSSAIVNTAKTIVANIKEGNYCIMRYLDKLSLPKDCILQVDECKEEGIGCKSHLFVETSKGHHDYKIWDYIKAENTIDGAWQAYLLYKLWHTLPLFWHANYDRRTYLYSKGDEISIDPWRIEDTVHIRGVVNSLFVNPDVVKGQNNKYYISCCYWSDFEGLIKEITEVSISHDNLVVIKDISKRTLYKYNCGIIF